MSDDDEDDYHTDSDNDWYDDEDDVDIGDYCMCGMEDSDHMDYEPYRVPAQSDQQAIYNKLNIPNPNNAPKNPLPLLDICASKIALNFPFAYIEDRNPPIPENVQLKIISYSFPQHMEKIKRYCSLNNGSSSEFDKAIKFVKSVKDLTQIGFHLSANVEYREVRYGGPPEKKTPYLYINMKFDRGKITETNCPCENSSSWCSHVIAVCLARIFLHDECVVKPPLSDSLNNVTTYAQLRTLTQYLIAKFSDRRIVESAQNVLDRMVKPQRSDEDAINATWGAPDPTAGPGLDETSQWLICEEALTSRCTALIQSSDVTEGCWGTNVGDLDNLSSSVWERWKMTQIEKPIVEDYFNNLESIPGSFFYSYNHYTKTYSREKSQEITKFLKTCEELLRDDFGYSLKAVQTFTVQLMDIIEERNKRNAYRVNREKFESNFHFGCAPRPQPCWLFRDQLARLWRLLVLNPSISAKDREEMFTTLEVLEAKLHSNDGKKQYLEWDSPKHIQHLKTFTWESLQLSDDPFKSGDPSEICVLKSAVIDCNVQRSTRAHFPDPSEQFPLPSELRCGDFSSSVTVYCYLVEALSVYGKTEQAVHLAMNVALAIVKYYTTWLEGSLHVNVQNTLCVDHDDKQENEAGKKGKGGRKKRQNRKRGRAGTKKAEEENEKSDEMLFDQMKGIIPITSVAYLMDLLDQNQDLLAEMLKLVKLRGLGLSEEELMECDDVTSDAKSLIFRLGVVGLGMPTIQAPSLQIQVEWFNWEVYVSQKLMQSTPSTGDVDFMKIFTARMIGLCEFGFHPPHALVMNLFHHSCKPGTNQFEEGISVAMKTIVASPSKQNGVSIHRRTFLECLRRHWVKLCEIVLCRVSASGPQLSDALKCLFKATNMIGTTCEDFNVKPGKKTAGRNKKKLTRNVENLGKKTSNVVRNTKLVQGMCIEKVVANLYLAYVLVSHANSLKATPDGQPLAESDKQSGQKLKGVVGYVFSKVVRRPINQRLVAAAEEGKKSSTSLTEQQQSLYETAVTLASRAFAVKNFTCHQLQMENFNDDNNFMEFMQRGLKWMCAISGKIGVKTFDLIILERLRLHFGPVKCFSDEESLEMMSLKAVWLEIDGNFKF